MDNQMPFDPQGAPQQPQKGGMKNPAFARLAALIPIALAKGGRAGVAGLIQGYQQGLLRKQQQAQQGQQIDFNQQQALAQGQRADRQLGLQEQQFARTTEQDAIRAKELERARFLEQAQAMGAIDQSPEAAMTALSGLAPQATALGVPQAALETQFAVTPSAAQARKIRGLLARVDTEWKGKADQEQIDAMVVQDPVAQGKTVGQLRAMLTGVAAPTGPKADKYAALKQTLTANPRQWNNLTPSVQTELLASGFVPPKGSEAPSGVTSGATDAKRTAVFNQIVGQYQRSPLVNAVDRTAVLADAISTIRQNPRDPAAQLSLAYGFIQGLDTYQSAVREGELQNLGVLGTRLQNLVTQVNRVATEGAFLPPEVVLNIAANAEQMIQAISGAKDRKEAEFASRARVSGVGDMWTDFISGARPAPVDKPKPKPSTAYERYKAGGAK